LIVGLQPNEVTNRQLLIRLNFIEEGFSVDWPEWFADPLEARDEFHVHPCKTNKTFQ
jgi:hypothetical protein